MASSFVILGEEPQEYRPSDQGGYDANGSIGAQKGEHESRQHIAEKQEDSTPQDGAWKEHPVVGTHDLPHGMGDHKSYKTDEAAHRYGNPNQEGGYEEDVALYP